jgi:hypothetical protein
MRCKASIVLAFLALSASVASAQDSGGIVRIPSTITPRCINAKTDEITVTLRRVKTQKHYWFVIQDTQAGVTVISTLNADTGATAYNPAVNLISIQDAGAGQVYLPLEYSVASLLPLSTDGGKTYTKSIQLEMYIDKLIGPSSFGQILDQAGTILQSLPIPANPYEAAVAKVIDFATNIIKTQNPESQKFAKVLLQFEDQDQANIQQCHDDGFQYTGVIGVIGPKGATNVPVLPLNKLSSDYCWSYDTQNTYEIRYAPMPATGGCAAARPAAFKEVPNDYVMLVVSAQKRSTPAAASLQRTRDLAESLKLCTAMKLAPILCGVH